MKIFLTTLALTTWYGRLSASPLLIEERQSTSVGTGPYAPAVSLSQAYFLLKPTIIRHTHKIRRSPATQSSHPRPYQPGPSSPSSSGAKAVVPPTPFNQHPFSSNWPRMGFSSSHPGPQEAPVALPQLS
jgi:hypothetical protein